MDSKYTANVNISRFILRTSVFLWLCMVGVDAWAQTFVDMFGDRILLTGASVTLVDSNVNATLEPFEPHHADKQGGHSVWVSWKAPNNGLVTINTTGSSFDTVLGVYILQPGTAPELQRLQEASSNDDDDIKHTSRLQFGATANQIYQIAVDGFAGQTGTFNFQLNFTPSAYTQPIVLRRMGDQALRLGDPLILYVTVSQYRDSDIVWYCNGVPIPDAEKPILVVPNLQPANLGLYTVRMELNDDNFFTAGIEVQVNSEGQTNVLARNKLPDAQVSGLGADGGGAGPSSLVKSSATPSVLTPSPAGTPGLALGYNGSQIFNTTYASIDTNEPAICGQTGGASYWFYYKAPASGIMSIDTKGSSIPTLLGVFTCNGVPTNYATLIPVTCDGASSTNSPPAQVQFNAQSGTDYYIVIDGLNGARGVARINYALNTNLPPSAPVITEQPQSLFAGVRVPIALRVVASSVTPLAYQWYRGTTRLYQQTNGSLLISNPQSGSSGNYSVVVSNGVGVVTSAVANVTVLTLPRTSIGQGSNMISMFPGNPTYSYTVDSAPSLNAQWNFVTNLLPDFNGVIWVTNLLDGNSNSAFVRAHTP